jgi:RimJ/RimL family protein N-acetyltransferase
MQLAPAYPVETERLRLRPFSRGDVDAVFAYRSRDDVSRFMLDGPMSREACAEAVQARIGQVAWEGDGDKILLAVERREDAVLIGEVVLILRNAESMQAEIGYILHPDHQGHGYATEAAGRLLELAFAAGVHRTCARCHARNDASWRVMERLGMRREAHLREHVLVHGAWAEEFIYAILEDEWRLRR